MGINSVQISETNIPTNTSTNDQPSSSNLAIQPCAPAKTNVPSPPTIFLDSILLAHVCENIFQELNNLIQARNNLVHKNIYEKQWKRLKERVDYVLSARQKSCLDAQDVSQLKFPLTLTKTTYLSSTSHLHHHPQLTLTKTTYLSVRNTTCLNPVLNLNRLSQCTQLYLKV